MSPSTVALILVKCKVEALGKARRFLIMHGTGDDNVHFQHTLKLLDRLNLKAIENYDVHVFPDSDHLSVEIPLYPNTIKNLRIENSHWVYIQSRNERERKKWVEFGPSTNDQYADARHLSNTGDGMR